MKLSEMSWSEFEQSLRRIIREELNRPPAEPWSPRSVFYEEYQEQPPTVKDYLTRRAYDEMGGKKPMSPQEFYEKYGGDDYLRIAAESNALAEKLRAAHPRIAINMKKEKIDESNLSKD